MYLKKNNKVERRQFLYIADLHSYTAASILASSLSALKIWVLVEFQSRVNGGREVVLSTELCRKFGILNRKAKESGLRHWERAGIFRVQRPTGKNPRVTVVQQLGRQTRSTTVLMNQVASMSGEHGNIVTFNEGEHVTARVIREGDQKKLEKICRDGDKLDADLVDYGTGWIIDKIRPPSAEWKSAHIEIHMSATEHGSEAGGGGGQPLAQPQATAAPDSEAWFVTNYAISHAPLPTLPTQTMEPVTAAP